MQTPLTKPQRPKQQLFNHCKPATSAGGIGVGSKEVEVLVGLGLTGRQARVYFALLKTGGGKAKAVADLSLVNRQEIYRIIDSLQQIGLVQRNITAPTTFVATPLAEVTKTLLAQKTSELNLIRQKTRRLTKKHQPNPAAAPVEKLCLGTVFEGDRGKKYRQAIQASCQSINAIVSWQRFKQLTTLFETQLQNTLQNGITIRIATNKPQSQPLPNWITNTQNQTQTQTQTQAQGKKLWSFQLKTFPCTPAAAITIFDGTQAAIAFDPNSSLTHGPDLWTTNPTLTALSQAYFNNVWNQTNASTI